MSIEDSFNKVALKFSWTTGARQTFYKMMANFIADGVPVFDALDELGKRWVQKKDAKAVVVKTIMADLRGQSGKSLRFGEAMAKWAPSMEAMAIDAGEQSGDIAEGLRMANRLTETTGKIKSTIIGELIYPAFLVLIFVAFLFVLRGNVIPVFEEILPRESWSTLPKILGFLAENVEAILGVFFGSIAAVTGIYYYTKGRWTGDLRTKFDYYVIPWTVNREVSGAIILTCFAALTKAGVPFSSIIERLSANASMWELYHLSSIRSKMRRGISDGEALACDLFDEEVRWEISVYARLSGFAKALDSLSERVIAKVLGRIQIIMTIIRSIVMLGIAGLAVMTYGSFFAITMAAKSAVNM